MSVSGNIGYSVMGWVASASGNITAVGRGFFEAVEPARYVGSTEHTRVTMRLVVDPPFHFQPAACFDTDETEGKMLPADFDADDSGYGCSRCRSMVFFVRSRFAISLLRCSA
jgi:hypothetical protein